MKNISKFILGACLASTVGMNTSCIEETFPTSGATQEQLGSSAKATEALLWAMPAFFNNLQTAFTSHFDWGYGSTMHIRDVMTEDMPVIYSDYDHYYAWEANKGQGPDDGRCGYMWYYYYKLIQTTNNIIAAVDPETASVDQLGYLGAGYAMRAHAYLDMAQMFEFLPNDVLSATEAGNDVTNLTVPIVTEATTEDEARNNPRATREKMAEFILGDLEKAKEYIVNLATSSKTLPHLDVVYGLMARCYMWLGDYSNAKTAARNAINESSVSPMSEDACLNTSKGFNTLSAWMWGVQQMAEDNVVQTGIVNWTSWMSPEATYGYAAAGPMSMIDKNMYERISDNDFRKKMWVAPEGAPLYGKTPYLVPGTELPAYVGVKFRPNEGNSTDYKVASASAYPLMRVEEMYFIEAEAAAHLNPADGLALLESFMKTYRNPKYFYKGAETAEDGLNPVVEEIVFQKRVELWGEGLTFFDVKRLNMSVTRAYEGTNFQDMAQLNTVGRPAWMNFCIIINEINNNQALVDYNNPNPTDAYIPGIPGAEGE